MRPDALADLVEVGDPRVSPDGQTVAFVVTRPDLASNTYRSMIWVAGVDGNLPACPFTEDSLRCRLPRWSPDGTQLAFVIRTETGGSIVTVEDIEGGQPISALEWPDEIDELAWAPDGASLVLGARCRDEERYGPEKDRDRPARRVDRVAFRTDNIGWTIDRPRHLLVVDVDGGVPRPLTSGPFQDGGFAVTSDTVVFSSARTPSWDVDLSTHLYRLPADAGPEVAPEALTDGRSTHGQPSISADGRWVAFVWGDRHLMPSHGQIGVVDLSGGEPERLLTTALDRHCAPYLASARDPVWDSPTSLLFQVDDAGNVPLYRVDLDGVTTEVVGGDRQVSGFDAAGGTLAFVATDAVSPTELFVVVDGAERRLTQFGAPLVKAHPPVAPQRFTATSADGTEVEAWFVPPAVGSGLRPALLVIHGGPFSQYGNRFSDEFQVLAGSGYGVVYANPRGSSGYSSDFARAVRGPGAADHPGSGWGSVDFADVMAVVDAAIDRFAEVVDPDRLGILGGSYGGYLTSWAIGHTDRFAAALSERACNNLYTFAHTSDIGASFPAGYIGRSHLDDPDEFLRQSPVTYFRGMQTPLMILHSENDLRCPIEQAEDLYLRLKLTGRDVEFVRFPGESHELSRSGAPAHRVERFEIILDWFARKL